MLETLNMSENLHAYFLKKTPLSTGCSIPALVYHLMVIVANPHGYFADGKADSSFRGPFRA